MLGFVLGDCGALAIGKRPLSVPAINWTSSAPYTVRKPGAGPQRVSCNLGNDYRVLSLSLIATALLAVYSGKTLSVSPCISGAGPGCDAAAEGSPLIRSLQEKSRANKEKNFNDVREKYWKEGYGTYFRFGFNKDLKRNEDGTWELVKPESPIESAKRRLNLK